MRIIFLNSTKRKSPFLLIIKSLEYYLQKKFNFLIINLNKITEFNFLNNDVIIMFSYQFHTNKKFLDKNFKLIKKYKIIIYNTEKLGTGWFKLLSVRIKKRASIILDYSKININYLKIFNKPKYYLPFGYSPYLETIFSKYIKKNVKKDIDILFYGYINNRRSKILRKIKNKKVVKFRRVKFSNLVHYIQRSKIILLINSNNKECQIDFARASLLISNKCFIIHEEISNIENPEEFNKYIVTSKYNNFPETCIKYLNKSEEKRQDIANKAYQWYKTYYCMDKFIPYEIFK